MDLGSFASDALGLALALLVPALIASFAVGLVLAFFEVMTQGQDASFAFVPRLLAVIAAVFLGRELMGTELVAFTGRVFEHIALVAR